jgi:hypothetical protein
MVAKGRQIIRRDVQSGKARRGRLQNRVRGIVLPTDLLRRMNSRLAGGPPLGGLRRRNLVHAGGRSAHGSQGAISIACTPPPPNFDAHSSKPIGLRFAPMCFIIPAVQSNWS